jgi:hypothetical protein
MQVNEGHNLTLSDAENIGKVFRQWAEGKKFAVLLDATLYFTVEPAAMQLLSSKEFTKDRVAAAMVTSSLANRLIGNFFVQLTKKRSSSKMFSNENEAIKWLQKQLIANL